MFKPSPRENSRRPCLNALHPVLCTWSSFNCSHACVHTSRYVSSAQSSFFQSRWCDGCRFCAFYL